MLDTAAATTSATSTPLLRPSAFPASMPPPSPSPLASSATTAPAAVSAADPLAALPPLTLGVLTSHEDKVDALRLVADSIAQQRQAASLVLVFHPLCLAGLAVGLAGAFQYSWVMRRDVGIALMMHSAAVMAYLLAIRWATGKYLSVAEDLKWDWLVPRSDDGSPLPGYPDEDTVIGTRFGDEIIGALVLRLEPNLASDGSASPVGTRSGRGNKGGRSTAAQLKGGRGVIRAWTVRLKFRHQGVGSDMLHEAVKVTREKCGKDAEVGFAAEHANSTQVLPDIFNKSFRRKENMAAKALNEVLADWEGNKRKR